MDSHDVALAVSPLARAMAPAAIRPAISEATDDGDLPYCSSHRSVVSGPVETMWFAVVSTLAYVEASVRPVSQASRIASASWSSCSQQPSCWALAPLTPETGL